MSVSRRVVVTMLTKEQADWFEAECQRLGLAPQEFLRELVDRGRRKTAHVQQVFRRDECVHSYCPCPSACQLACRAPSVKV